MASRKAFFYDPNSDVYSLFTAGSEMLFGNTGPGESVEMGAQILNIIRTPARIALDPKGPDVARNLLSGGSDAFGLPEMFTRLTNQRSGE